MKTQIREENERIRQKNRDAQRKAYENMQSVLNDKVKHDVIKRGIGVFERKRAG